MQKNIGEKERTVRILVGLGILLATSLGAVHGIPAVVMAVAAAVLTTTGLLHYCPLYAVCKCSNFEDAPKPAQKQKTTGEATETKE